MGLDVQRKSISVYSAGKIDRLPAIRSRRATIYQAPGK
jgi:hypothetical protein